MPFEGATGARLAGPSGSSERSCRGGKWFALFGPTDGDAHSRLFDRDFADPGFLDDPHELADPFGASLVDAAARKRLVPARTSANGSQQRLGVVAEEAEQKQLLLAGGKPFRLGPDLVQRRRRRVFDRVGIGRQADGTLNRLLDRCGRRAEVACDQRAQLVDHDGVTAGRQDVQQRLRAEHLADRRRERRPTHFGADQDQLLDRLVEPAACRLCTQVRIECGDETGRQVVLRSAHRNARRKRRHGLVADVLVDDVGRIPERFDVDVALEPKPDERLDERFTRDPVQRERDREDRARDQLRARAACFEGGRERVATRALAVDSHRQSRSPRAAR